MIYMFSTNVTLFGIEALGVLRVGLGLGKKKKKKMKVGIQDSYIYYGNHLSVSITNLIRSFEHDA